MSEENAFEYVVCKILCRPQCVKQACAQIVTRLFKIHDHMKLKFYEAFRNTL